MYVLCLKTMKILNLFQERIFGEVELSRQKGIIIFNSRPREPDWIDKKIGRFDKINVYNMING